MRRSRLFWAVIAVLSPLAGALIVRFRLISPGPGSYFVLGALAVLCLAGIALGIDKGRRIAKSGTPIEN